jgi:hypothetical protein
VVGAGPGPPARLAAGRHAQGAADHRPRRDPDPSPQRQAGRGRDYKQGFGFHPLAAWLDRGDGTGEALSGVLRPGNAAANTAQDHRDVLAMALLALLALPKPARGQPILVRCDSAGATHAFLDELVHRNLQFSIGFDCDQRVQAAILACPRRPSPGPWTLMGDPAGAPGSLS